MPNGYFVANGRKAKSWKRNKEQTQKALSDGKNGRSGYVYAFRIGEGLYKIGMTIDVQKRIKSLSAACPSLSCVWIVRVNDMYLAEKELHNAFHFQKLKREIFRMKSFDISKADRIAEKYK